MDLDLTGFDEAKQQAEQAPQTLDLAAFDSAKRLEEQYTQEPSQLEALVRGGAQGASLGFADEITGGAEALKDTVTGESALTDLLNQYKKRRDESRAAYGAAEQAHPITYTGGQIAGGFAVPGLNLVKGGTGAMTGLAKLGARAAEGAALGAAGAYGMTNEEGMDALSEAGKGAAVGAVANPVLGGLLDKLVPTIKKVGSQFADPDLVSTAFNKAKAGESLAGKEALQASQQRLFDYVRDDLMPLVLDESKDAVSKAYDDALSVARSQGRSVNVQDVVDSVNQMASRERMAPEDVKKINDLLNRFGQKEEVITGIKQVSPKTLDPQAEFERKQLEGLQRTQDVKEMRSQLSRAGEPSLGGQQPGTFRGEGPAFGSDLIAARSQSASPTVKAMKSYDGQGEYSTIGYITDEVFKKPNLSVDDLTDLKRRLDILAKSNDPVESQAAIEMSTRVKNLIRDTAGTDNYKMADQLRKIQSDAEAKFGVASVEGQPILTKDRQAFESKARQITRNMVLGADDPSNLQNLSMKEGFGQLSKIIPERTEQLQRQGDKLAQEALTSEFLNSRKIFVNPLNPKGSLSFEPAVAKTADWAGKVSRKVHDWTDNDLAQAVQYLYTSGKNTYAKMLEQAMLAPGEKRRALLFALTQNPEFRNSLFGNETEN